MEDTTQPQNQSMQSETIGELAKALSEAQKTELFALTDSTNPFFSSKYANISSVWGAIRTPLTDNGLAVIQTTDVYPDGVILITTLIHKSGEWIRGRLAGTIVPDKKGNRTPQGLLALITYLRRAGLSAITGVCPYDDDGETVMGREVSASATDKKLVVDDHPMIDYSLPGEDSQAMKDLREYKPETILLDDEKTHFRVGKFEVMITEDGKKVWSNVPKFGTPKFDVGACLPCLFAGLIRAHGVAFIGGKYDLVFKKPGK